MFCDTTRYWCIVSGGRNCRPLPTSGLHGVQLHRCYKARNSHHCYAGGNYDRKYYQRAIGMWNGHTLSWSRYCCSVRHIKTKGKGTFQYSKCTVSVAISADCFGFERCLLYCTALQAQCVTAALDLVELRRLIKKNSVALVRERTIPTEWPPPVGEVSANFCYTKRVLFKNTLT